MCLACALVIVGDVTLFGGAHSGNTLAAWIGVSLLVVVACWGRGGAVGWLWLLWGLMAFVILRGVADDLSPLPVHAEDLRALEEWMFFGATPSLVLQRALFVPGTVSLVDHASFAVYASYFFAPYLVAFGVWLAKPALVRRLAHLLVLLFMVSAVFHFLAPTVPPWLVPADRDTQVHKILYVVATSALPETYDTVYKGIGGSNPIAAMPSVHFAVTFMLFLFTIGKARYWTVLGALYSAAMVWALVYLGEHYVVDCIVGGLVAWAVWYGYERMWRREGHSRTE